MSLTLPLLVTRTVDRLIAAFAPKQVIVFGSYAKGTHHARSDVDLLIVADLPGDPAHHLRRARQLAADSFPRVDVVFCTSEEVAGAASARSPFLASILSSGVTVFPPDRETGRQSSAREGRAVRPAGRSAGPAVAP